MANPAMFKVTFTIICVKLESMSQAIYRLAGKFTLGWRIVVTTVYSLYFCTLNTFKSIA